MLSPTACQRIPTHTEVENEEISSGEQLATQEQRRKGKSIAITEANSHSELLALLKEMKA